MIRLLLAICMLSLTSVSALGNEIEASAGVNLAWGDESLKNFSIAYEVVETGNPRSPINWDATVNIMHSEEPSGSILLYPDGEAVSGDGEAYYAAFGIQARKMIIRDFLEGALRAEYAQRIPNVNGKKDGYEIIHGKAFNDFGGLNLSAGATMVFRRKYGLGAIITRNVHSDTTSVRVIGSLKFGVRDLRRQPDE